jgi:hypothetical protein
MKKFEFDELIERAFCEGYELAQKEFGVKRIFEKARNCQERVIRPHGLLQDPTSYANFVGKTTNLIIHPLEEVAERDRHKVVGARSIAQLDNIVKNHTFRLTPRREEIIKNALKNREDITKSITSYRQDKIDSASRLLGHLYK